MTYFELHCKDQGILADLDEFEVAAPSMQSPYAYFGDVPVGPATCPRTGVVITAPSARTSADGRQEEFVELELSPQLSQHHGIAEWGGTEPQDGEFYVLRLFPSGQKKTVVERENNILTLEEAQRHSTLAEQAMLDEMTRWHTLGAFQRMDKRLASNVTETLGIEVEDR